MPAPDTYLLFLGVMAVLAITPGPANLFAVATGIARGPGPALMGVVGMNCATLIWFAAAALGLSALVTAFPEAFQALAIVGALYVGWLGLKALWNAIQPGGKSVLEHAIHAAKPGAAFRDGLLVQLSNPKAVLFFTAVLPPFLDPARPTGIQLAAFAAAAIGMDGVAMAAYALAGGALATKMSEPDFARLFSAGVGLLLLLAAALILIR